MSGIIGIESLYSHLPEEREIFSTTTPTIIPKITMNTTGALLFLNNHFLFPKKRTPKKGKQQDISDRCLQMNQTKIKLIFEMRFIEKRLATFPNEVRQKNESNKKNIFALHTMTLPQTTSHSRRTQKLPPKNFLFL